MTYRVIFLRKKFGICRHRNGITTLVDFMRCPLKCRYCLNYKCHAPLYENITSIFELLVEAYTSAVVNQHFILSIFSQN